VPVAAERARRETERRGHRSDRRARLGADADDAVDAIQHHVRVHRLQHGVRVAHAGVQTRVGEPEPGRVRRAVGHERAKPEPARPPASLPRGFAGRGTPSAS